MIEILAPKWEQEDASAEPCRVCEELIFTKGFRMHINGEPTEMVVCKPCYELAVKTS